MTYKIHHRAEYKGSSLSHFIENHHFNEQKLYCILRGFYVSYLHIKHLFQIFLEVEIQILRCICFVQRNLCPI